MLQGSIPRNRFLSSINIYKYGLRYDGTSTRKFGKKALWSLLNVHMHSRGGSFLAFIYNLLLNCMRTYKCTKSCETFIKNPGHIQYTLFLTKMLHKHKKHSLTRLFSYVRTPMLLCTRNWCQIFCLQTFLFDPIKHLFQVLSPCPRDVPRRNIQFFYMIPSEILGLSFLHLPKLLKVLTNEKRGGLRVISFDRSPFKLFSQKFSKESVQAPTCERHKTTQRTLFLLFANNNWFPITLLCLTAAPFSHRKLNWNIGIVHPSHYLRWR